MERAAHVQAYIDCIDDLFVRGARMTTDGATIRVGLETALSSHLAALGITPGTRAPP
jgi:hypothetical protein